MKTCEIAFAGQKNSIKLYFLERAVICCPGYENFLFQRIILFSRTLKIEHLIVRINMKKKEERLY
jgi:hypothetical protein